MKKSVFSSIFLLSWFILVSQATVAGSSSDCPRKFAGAEVIYGTSNNDTFVKGAASNKLSHVVNGNIIATYTLSPNKNYIINTGAGNDFVTYTGGTIKHVQICTGSGDDRVNFGQSSPSESGNAKSNYWVYTGSGEDAVYGNGQRIYVSSGAGRDLVKVWKSVSVSISGDNGDDCLISNNHRASLNGLGGNDVLIATHGSAPQASTLNGSGGSDICIVTPDASGDERFYSCESISYSNSACEYFGW